MRKNYYLLISFTILAFAVVSCGLFGDKKVKVKPETTDVSGALRDYLEVVRGEYEINQGDLIRGELSIKVRAIKSIPPNMFNSKIILQASILDEEGMPVSGVKEFKLSSNSEEVLMNLLKAGNGTEVIHLVTDIDGFDKKEYGKKCKKFTVSSMVKLQDNLTTTFSYESDKSNINKNGIPGKYPFASTRLLTMSDLENYSAEELRIMRNEIFARHGYIFKTPEMKLYFANQPWYTPKYSDVSRFLTDIEKKNIELIKTREKFLQ